MVELTEGVTSLVPVTATAFAGDPSISYEYPNEVPGEVLINVLAEDLTTTSTYSVALTLYTDIEESTLEGVRLYPNPTTGFVFVEGVEDADISIYSINGQLINGNSLIENNKINMSSLPNGVYLIKVQKEGTILTKKVSLIK